MLDARGRSLSKPARVGRRSSGAPARWMLVAGFLAPAGWLVAGCGSGGDLISTVALPSQQTADYTEGADLPISPDVARHSGTPDLTPAQRDYLGALANAGIHPFNDLRALSIGAYVCQARAAGQSDQTVWDSVAPMVRSDVIEASTGFARQAAASAQNPMAAGDVDALVGEVIHIATQKLC